MGLGQELAAIGLTAGTESYETLTRALDPQRVQSVLEATAVRRRKLPAEHAIWTVIGMALFRDRPIQAVVHHLDLVLSPSKASTAPGIVTGSAVAQARDRLGAVPLAQLFELTATHWARTSAERHRWHGLAIYGIDGTTLRVADTPENEQAFGRPGSGRGKAGYPQLRLVGLMVLRSHLLAGLACGGWTEGEITLADPSQGEPEVAHRQEARPEGLAGRDHAAAATAPSQPGPPGNLPGARDPLPAARLSPADPAHLAARPPPAYPATEIAALYHERWELELGFDEIKTHTLEREEALRSRAPERVLQEVWGLAIAYNLVRLHMEHVALHVGIAPVRVSFRGTLRELRILWTAAWSISPGTLPRMIERLHRHLALLILPPRRPRQYPRAVKIKMSNYPRNV